LKSIPKDITIWTTLRSTGLISFPTLLETRTLSSDESHEAYPTPDDASSLACSAATINPLLAVKFEMAFAVAFSVQFFVFFLVGFTGVGAFLMCVVFL
jgi:hypothetical protein